MHNLGCIVPFLPPKDATIAKVISFTGKYQDGKVEDRKQ